MKPRLHPSSTNGLHTVRFGITPPVNWRNHFNRVAVNYLSKVFILLFMDFYPSLKH